MRNGNKYDIRLTRAGDHEERDDGFRDDFERDAMEGLAGKKGWRSDVREMKGEFRRKWGIPYFPVYVRFTMYTLATAVCLVFVFIISERWYDLKENSNATMVADQISEEDNRNVTDSMIVSQVPDALKQTEAQMPDQKITISSQQQVMTGEAKQEGQGSTVTRSVSEYYTAPVNELVSDRERAEKKNAETTLAEDVISGKDKLEQAATTKADQLLGGDALAEKQKKEEDTDLSSQEQLAFSTAVTGTTTNSNNRQSLPATSGLVTLPVVYEYDLAVVDYTQLRTPQLLDGNLDDSGISPGYENEESKKNESKVTATESPADKRFTYVDFLNGAMRKFSSNLFGSALADFEIILKQYPGDLNALFYGGLCNYHLKRNDKALQYLNQVMVAHPEVFYFEAEWYKALTLIQSGKKEEAKNLLEKIAAGNGFYKSASQKKLSEWK